MNIQKVCPLCNSGNNVSPINFGLPIFQDWSNPSWKHINKYFCKRCFFCFVFPVPSKDELSKFYENIYRSKISVVINSIKTSIPIEMSFSEISFERAINFDKLYTKNKNLLKNKVKLLDIGGYQGLFAWSLSQSYGFDCTVTDYDKDGLNFAHKFLGLKIINQESLNHETKYDIITLVQVLEHVIHPVDTLSDIKNNLLKHNGLVYIEVPNMLNFPISDPVHLTDFSVESMEILLYKTGFKVLDMKLSKSPTFKIFPGMYHSITVLAQSCDNIEGEVSYRLPSMIPRLHYLRLYYLINIFKIIVLNNCKLVLKLAIINFKLIVALLSFVSPFLSNIIISIKKTKE